MGFNLAFKGLTIFWEIYILPFLCNSRRVFSYIHCINQRRTQQNTAKYKSNTQFMMSVVSWFSTWIVLETCTVLNCTKSVCWLTLNSFLSVCIKTIRGLRVPQPSYCTEHIAATSRYILAQQIAQFNNVSLLRAVLWTEISRTAIQRQTLSVVADWRNTGLAHAHTQLSSFNWGPLKGINLGTASHSRGILLRCPQTVRNTSGTAVLRAVGIHRGTVLRPYGAERRIEPASLTVT